MWFFRMKKKSTFIHFNKKKMAWKIFKFVHYLIDRTMVDLPKVKVMKMAFGLTVLAAPNRLLFLSFCDF